jgi:hypothetical protein
MGRKEFSGEVVVQKTIGTNISTLDDSTVDENVKVFSFRANLINYIFNKGDIPIIVDFVQNGVSMGEKEITNGFGIDNIYLQIDELQIKTTQAGQTIVDAMGVY